MRVLPLATDPAGGFRRRPEAALGAQSVPGDYVYDLPHLLGTARIGPDLLNIGARQPSRDWHLAHLYDPRSAVAQSIMPRFPWLFADKTSTDPEDVMVAVPAPLRRPGVSVVATREALDLYEYLLGMNHTYPLERTRPR